MGNERAEGDLYLLEEQRALLALSFPLQDAAQCPWEAQQSSCWNWWLWLETMEPVSAHSCLEVEVCGVNELVTLEGLKEIAWCLDSPREGGFVVHLVACRVPLCSSPCSTPHGHLESGTPWLLITL